MSNITLGDVKITSEEGHLIFEDRRFENQYGIFFPDCMRQGILDPPEQLSYIVGELEREWLSD